MALPLVKKVSQYLNKREQAGPPTPATTMREEIIKKREA
jgi:hypothetical protein